MIRRGDIDAVWRAVKGLEPSKATTAALVDAVASAGIQSGAAEAARFSMAFNQPAEEAIRFAARDAAKLGMHDMDKGLVRTILSRGVEAGHHPRVTARHLKAITPILPRHQKAVDRYYQGILDGGGTEAFAARMRDRRAAKLKRYRAKMIARTEASRSANMGQQQIWDQAVAADLLPADTKKKWVATPGACPICTNLDGKAVPVKGTFTTGGQSPPAHPHCRCTMVIDRIPTPQRQRPQEPATGTAQLRTYDPDTGKLVDMKQTRRGVRNLDDVPEALRDDTMKVIDDALDDLPEGWRPADIEFVRDGRYAHSGEYDGFGQLAGKRDTMKINTDVWFKDGAWDAEFGPEKLREVVTHEAGHKAQDIARVTNPKAWDATQRMANTTIKELADTFDLDAVDLWTQVGKEQMAYPIMQSPRFAPLTRLVGDAGNELISEVIAYGTVGTLDPKYRPLWKLIKEGLDAAI